MSTLKQRINQSMAETLFKRWLEFTSHGPSAFDVTELGNEHLVIYEFHMVGSDGKSYLMIFLNDHTCKIVEVLRELETELYECIACDAKEVTCEESLEEERNWMVGQTFGNEDLSPMCMDCTGIYLNEHLVFQPAAFLRRLAEVTDVRGNIPHDSKMKKSFVRMILKEIG